MLLAMTMRGSNSWLIVYLENFSASGARCARPAGFLLALTRTRTPSATPQVEHAVSREDKLRNMVLLLKSELSEAMRSFEDELQDSRRSFAEERSVLQARVHELQGALQARQEEVEEMSQSRLELEGLLRAAQQRSDSLASALCPDASSSFSTLSIPPSGPLRPWRCNGPRQTRRRVAPGPPPWLGAWPSWRVIWRGRPRPGWQPRRTLRHCSSC